MPPRQPPAFDPERPSVARIVDYWLGGTDHFPADVAAAKQAEQVNPDSPGTVRRNRQFTARAVTWAAGRGITQFLDLGSGLPTMENTHDTARAVHPDARVVYVDSDPVTVSHADALLACPGVAVAEADLARPGEVLAHEAVREIIVPGEPLCVIFSGVLHFMPATAAREVAAGYVQRIASGSVVVISVVRTDDAPALAGMQQIAGQCGIAISNFTMAEIAALFGGLDLVQPGIVAARAWRGGMPDPGLGPAGIAQVLGGVGIKP